MASTLIRPLVCPDAPRPLALIDNPNRPVRFLPHAKSALVLDGDKVSLIELAAGDVTAVDGFRAALLGGPQLELPAVGVSVAVAVAVTLTGVAFFWRTEDTIADVV